MQAEAGGWVCGVVRARRECDGNGTEGSGGSSGSEQQGVEMVEEMPADVIPTTSEVPGRNIREWSTPHS